MKIKSLIILTIGVVVIGMSAVTVPAEEISRENEVPNQDVTIEEYNPEEPTLISPSPYEEPSEDEIINEEEIIPLLDRDEPVPSGVTAEDESEILLISEADSKNSDDVKNSSTPVILIIGTVVVLIILLLVINRRK